MDAMDERPVSGRPHLLHPARLIALAALLGVVVFSHGARAAQDGAQIPGDEHEAVISIQLSGARDQVRLIHDEHGGLVYVITTSDGVESRLTPDEFAARLFDDQMHRGWLGVLFNVSSPIGFAWVAVGLLGQGLFAGRMVVQWIASERRRRSIVPASFWWMSLVGAAMLLAYFAWRRDVVGLLGQGLGFAIYIRNIWFIYAKHEPVPATMDPDSEPELAVAGAPDSDG
jgi:lipid-A-disaccharide synthase-like uncharacterized protein